MSDKWLPIMLAPQQTPVMVSRKGLRGWHAIAINSVGYGWVYYGDLAGPSDVLKYVPTHFIDLPSVPPTPDNFRATPAVLDEAANPDASGKWYARKPAPVTMGSVSPASKQGETK